MGDRQKAERVDERLDDIHAKQKKMLEAPVEGLILSLALPSTAIMLVTAVYNLADTYFVSGLGTSATAAIGVVFTLMSVIQAVGFLFGQGAGNYMSRRLGAEDYSSAGIMACTSFFLSMLSGGIIAIFGLFFLDSLLRVLGASETMLPYAREYTRWILVAAPFMTASLTLNNQLRFVANAKMAMYGMLTGALLNIGLDPLFIYVFHWGAGGAGLATCISQIISFCILVVAMQQKESIPIRLQNFKPSAHVLWWIVHGGSASLLRQVGNSLGTLCFNHTAGIFGDFAVAAISVVQRVTSGAISAIMGFGQGFQPVCGFNYGAKQYDRVIRGFLFCVKIVTLCLFTFSILGAFLAPDIIAIFRPDDPDVIAVGAFTLRMQCITLPWMGLVVLCNMLLQTIGASAKANTIAIARSGLFLMPSIFILVSVFGLRGLETAQLTADLLTIALALPLALASIRKMKALQN